MGEIHERSPPPMALTNGLRAAAVRPAGGGAAMRVVVSLREMCGAVVLQWGTGEGGGGG